MGKTQTIRVKAEPLQAFAQAVLQKSGMPEDKAGFLAELLVGNDLRGVFTHGTYQLMRYASGMRKGDINPDPQVRVVNETPSTVLLDGDGGLGYFPSYRAAEMLIDKARTCGVAAAVTRNHNHIGAAGIYAKLIGEHDLIAFVTSGHQLHLEPDMPVLHAGGGSPMAFAMPKGNGEPLVIDAGVTNHLSLDRPFFREMLQHFPGVVFRCLGLGLVTQALGGILAGVPIEEERAVRQFRKANQGSLIIAMDIRPFFSPDAFKKEMDIYMQKAEQMAPMPGYDETTVPGLLEYKREKEWRETGIPLTAEHVDFLVKTGGEFGVEPMFQ